MTERTLYVGTYTQRDSEGIYIYRFDTETGALRQEALGAEHANPSFLTLHPQGQILYAVDENWDAGQVSSYAIDPSTGGLTFLNRQPTHGTLPCHLVVKPDGSTLVVANYLSGSVAVYPLNSDGSVGEPSQLIQHEGSGPNQERQEGAHAHNTTLSPDGAPRLCSRPGYRQGDDLPIRQRRAGTQRSGPCLRLPWCRPAPFRLPSQRTLCLHHQRTGPDGDGVRL